MTTSELIVICIITFCIGVLLASKNRNRETMKDMCICGEIGKTTFDENFDERCLKCNGRIPTHPPEENRETMKELIEEEMKFLNEIINESRSGLLDNNALRLKCAKRLKTLQKAKEQLSEDEDLENENMLMKVVWNDDGENLNIQTNMCDISRIEALGLVSLLEENIHKEIRADHTK